jgi:signal transduction histidine kinase/DNA-binding response OmpR family regulator
MSETLRVLQVEDSESDAALVVRLLEKSGYRVHAERVEEAEPMRRALAREDWDVVIADFQLPQFDAGAALEILHESGRDIPFIVVSGMIGEDRAVEMMRAGAHDYVLKDRIARLVPAVQREIRECQSRGERRRAEEQLRDRDEWLALAVSVTQLGMFDFYPQSGKLIWSEGGRRHFGLPPDAEVTYETFLCGLHPDDRKRVDDLIQKAFDPASGGAYATDYRTIGLTDKVERWLAARGRVFFDEAFRPIRFVEVTMDITERKQLEEQFRQSQKLEGVGRLAGGVAHDFNNLLTVITGFSHITLAGLAPYDKLRGGMEEVLKAAVRATTLTEQLLAFSRRQPSRTEIVVLNELVENVEKMLGRLIGADVNVALVLDPAEGTIRADAVQIEQAIMNLVLNARDAMPNGGKLTIETAHQSVDERFAASHPDLAPGEYLALTVSDTGTGISDEVKTHIFEPFFTTKPQGKGTGLGLSTVYGIVKQCGGSISVWSEVGRGAEFRILLPMVDAPADQAQRVDAAVVPTVTMPWGTETILLAEDEEGVRRFVLESLERRGYRVLGCCNGREAIEQARQHPGAIDLLITDAVMPEMGGAELAAQFADCHPGVPVLCMSGYSAMVWPGAAAAESSYLQKPFTPAALLTRVRAMLDSGEASRAA